MSLETDRDKLLNPAYQKEVDRQLRAVAIWKRRYNLTSSDPRYKEATYTEILEDLAEIGFTEHLREYHAYDQATNEKLRKQVLDPNFDENEKKASADLIKKALGL